MILIYKGMRLEKIEYSPRAPPYLLLNVHATVKRINPQRNKHFLHVIFPRPNNMCHLPELLQKQGRQIISKWKLSDNFFKPCKGHKTVDTERVTLHLLHGPQ